MDKLLRKLKELLENQPKAKKPKADDERKCHKCGGTARRTKWKELATGRPIFACGGCGRTFATR